MTKDLTTEELILELKNLAGNNDEVNIPTQMLEQAIKHLTFYHTADTPYSEDFVSSNNHIH